jgi:hypothetical protein
MGLWVGIECGIERGLIEVDMARKETLIEV